MADKAKSEGFSAEEKAAMKERAKELKANASREAGEKDLLSKIAEMDENDRKIAEGIHAIVSSAAPELAPKTWYGQPAYARDGKVIVFFQAASKFNTRYATLGFSEDSALDDGAMWPTSFAVTKLGASEKEQITALVKKAVG